MQPCLIKKIETSLIFSLKPLLYKNLAGNCISNCQHMKIRSRCTPSLLSNISVKQYFHRNIDDSFVEVKEKQLDIIDNDISSKILELDKKLGVARISKNVLKPPSSSEDIDIIYPHLKPAFNMAAYVDKSALLKHFIHLGVEIAQWDKHKDICTYIINKDFEEDLKPYIFMIHSFGISSDDLGRWFTINPFVFKESLENLRIRINYLESKKFSKKNISTILNKTPKWINHSVVDIDRELGIYQKKFNLTDAQVRKVATMDPKLILYTMQNKMLLEKKMVTLNEMMGFGHRELKQLVLTFPRILRTGFTSLSKRFQVIHHEMGLPHEVILKFPEILHIRQHKLSERHQFLKFIGKDQYDPKKSNYVSPKQFLSNDAEFVQNMAQSIDVYNDFLKTL